MQFIIREADLSDAQAIHDIYGYYVENTCVTFSEVNPSVEAYAESIKEVKKTYPYFVAEDEEGKVVGMVYGGKLRHHDAYIWNVESTIYLSPDCPKHQGIGKALYLKFMDELAKMGYKYVYGVIEDQNEISIQMHEALGFEKVGHFTNIGYKFGAWRGIVWYRKQISDLSDMTLRV